MKPTDSGVYLTLSKTIIQMLGLLLENICYIDIKPGIYAAFQTARKCSDLLLEKHKKSELLLVNSGRIHLPRQT